MMTTMNKLAELNVTIDFALPMECYSVADFDAMDKVELDVLFGELSKEFDMDVYGIAKMEESRKELFYTIDAYLWGADERAFHEYASHKDEPDFDWDFYSDWHKDIYGCRPHW